MSKRLVKYSLVAGLALLLAAPAVAYSQRNTPRGQAFGPGAGTGPQAGGAAVRGPQGQGRFAGAAGAQRQRTARAEAPRPGRRNPAGRGMGPGLGAGTAVRALAHADAIGLSSEQRDQILAAQRAVREAQINRRAQQQIVQLELRDLMGAETRDLAAIEAKLRELSEQRVTDQIAGLRLDEAVGEVLTAEQHATLDELRDDRPGNRPGRNARGPRRIGR